MAANCLNTHFVHPPTEPLTICKFHAGIAQQVEHFLGKEEVTGSSPVISSTYNEKEQKGVDVINGCVNDWLDVIFANKHCENTYVIIVGTKSDMVNPEQKATVESSVKSLTAGILFFKGCCEYMCTSALD